MTLVTVAICPQWEIGDGGVMTLEGTCPLAAFSCPCRELS